MVWNWQLHEIIYLLLTVGWLLEFVFFPSNRQGQRARSTFLLVLMTVCGSILLNVLLVSFFGTGFPPGVLLAVRIFALVVFAGGELLRYSALLTIGNSFRREVRAEKDMRLVSSGPYTKLRHPLYLALWLQISGAVLFMGNLAGTLIAVFFSGFVLAWLAGVEERHLLTVVGEEYRNWAAVRAGFFPGCGVIRRSRNG